MDSRINLGEGFSAQGREFELMGYWVPATPEKPIPTRSNSMPIDRHGNHQLGRANYGSMAQDLGQIHQQGRNGSFAERNRMINHIAGSYTQALSQGSGSWNSNSFVDLLTMNYAAPFACPETSINRSMSMVGMPLIPDFHSQVNGLRESSSGELLFPNQTHCSSSNRSSVHCSLLQMAQYGLPKPYDPNLDINSLPSIEADAASTATNSFQFAPETPQLTKKLKNQLSATVNFPQEKGSSEGIDKPHDLVASVDYMPKQHNFDELLHNIVDSSYAVISTPFEEPKDSGKESDQVIGLNKTPQLKTQKRKKHRPKVVKEGKQNRTPKAATTKIADPKVKTTEKRKYVRKKGQQESPTQRPDSIGESTDSKEKLKERKNNVHKRDLRDPATQNVGDICETMYPSAGTAAPSCRRALNFYDLENTRDKVGSNSVAQQEILKKMESFNSNTGFHASESVNKTNMMYRTKSDLQVRQHSELLLENQESGAISNLTSSANQSLFNDTSISNRIEAGAIPISDRREAAVQLASTKDVQMNNLNANAREADIRMQQHLCAEGIDHTALPAKINCKGLERTGQLMPQNTQSVGDISGHLIQGRGYKREYGHVEQTSHCTANPPDHCTANPSHYHSNSCMFSTNCSDSPKKRKIENGIPTNTNGMLRFVAAVNHSVASEAQRNMEILKSYLDSNNIKRKENNGSIRFPVDCYTHQVASGQDLSKRHKLSGPNSCMERIVEANRSTNVQTLTSLTTVENYNMLPPTCPKTGRQPEGQLQAKTSNIVALMKQAMGHTQSKSIPFRDGKMLQTHVDILKDQQPPAKRKGRPPKQRFSNTIEEIIHRMGCLNLKERSNEMKGKEQNALVLYKGDGTLIPHGGFDFIKKRKPRPKVDLDPETERVWKLLMWKEGSEGVEGTDEEKKLWWEEERRVFRGRADSFIARMHLVQGDRRFSKWKGSVVDSVIGVFLTQNVSDHLSSSAFMSLAARFPIKSARNRTCERDGTRILVEEPDACMLNPNDTIKWNEKFLHHPFYNQNSVVSYESTEYRRDCETSWTDRTSMVEAHSHSPQEEVLSSQDSFDSLVIQSNGVRSYSGSNSEAEDHANGCKHSKNLNTSSTNLPHVESTTLFEEFYSQVSGRSLFHIQSRHGQKQPQDIENRQQQWPRLERLDASLKSPFTFCQQIKYNNPQMQVPAVPSSNYQLCATVQSEILEVESVELNREESISSWPSGASRFNNEKDASCTSKRVVVGAESVAISTAQQYGSSSYQETRIVDPHAFLSKQMINEQSNTEPYHGSQPHKIKTTIQLERKSMAETANLADAQVNGQSSYEQHISNIPNLTGKVFDVEERIALVDKQTRSENEIVESNLKEQVHVTNKESLKTNYLKAGKAKAGAENKDAIDWDSLRKQVQANGSRKERSQDTMDSLDYEAMRCASVNEISGAIKERGMNNLLAERIKEFLDRLVREHGSVDLEWLRDVPPDKAKDYLLSIRGLGLKSVECVRLLTLHHLAFPVDTNVGRIAVRLGWVPLQPLPESLQLHLLELYPVLESIQKYLWPRLCKLDQRTLYELHYQLITFGKVFCTKNKPNCNACPMRAECRHFASAFASARLALPGPEEKSIVTSTVPLRTERSPGIVIDPMPLPPIEENSIKRGGSDIISCVPIIEEPATPKQEHNEVTESDIEDINDEDTDEIPTIKLNMEELTVNLQNYMQANMELQECDMSKALVALNPEAASIPTPKLKNVSRLRTEHQVYELPDSHPLLKGMDKREPDDPSPYLLAIWIPDNVETQF
ncbi:transcriptional activator DEMETER isoform X2 [Hevea brasiliensis]|uniref:transcriptional activator DEMETER isoform X2 n=1 Tax=Hevea brasiliensis TaxID=3981 RepID=UPI0025D7F32F|nr:transcriptional activator DEMETER isoform X2 [Hevea brasiliensis]